MSRLIDEVVATSQQSYDPTPLSQQQRLEDDVALESDTIAIEHEAFEMEKDMLRMESLTEAAHTLESIHHDIQQYSSLNARQFYGYALAMESIHPSFCSTAIVDIQSDESISLERESRTLGENIKRIWEQIKKAIQTAIERVVHFFKKLFKGLKRFRKNVQNTQKKIKELQQANAQASVTSFETSKVNKLYIDGNFKLQDIQDGIIRVSENAYGSTGEINNAISLYYDNLENSLEGKPLAKQQVTQIVDHLVQNGYAFHASPALKESYFFEETGQYRWAEMLQLSEWTSLPGGKQIIIGVLTSRLPQSQYFALSPPRVVDINQVSQEVQEPDTNEAPMPNLEQMKKTLEALEALIGKMEDHEKLRDGLVKKRKRLTQKISDIIDNKEDMSQLEKTLGKAGMKTFFYVFQKEHTAGLSQIDRYVFTYARALHSFVKQAASYYQPGETSDSKAMVTT